MSSGVHLKDIFNSKSSMLLTLCFSVAILLGIEMLIFIAFSSAAGHKTKIVIKDKSGHVVARADTSMMDKDYLESKLGYLSNYNVEVSALDNPFLVRGWAAASVGVPIVLILLVSYLVKVYMNLLDGEESDLEKCQALNGQRHYFARFALMSSNSIFYLGVLVALASLLFWMAPNFVEKLAAAMAVTDVKAKPIVVPPVAMLVCIMVWIIYLRYRLSARMMDHQFGLQKYQLELERQADLEGRLAADIPRLANDNRNDDALPTKHDDRRALE